MAGKDNRNGGKRQQKWREETIKMAGRDNRNGGKNHLANDPNILKKTGKQMARFIS